MHDEVTEFMAAVPPRAVMLILIPAENDDRTVGERDREGVDRARLEQHPANDHPAALDIPDDVFDWACRQFPLCADQRGGCLDFGS
jgi:hypothetical protein